MRHPQIESKDVFVFDWDGTILDSMTVKARNFGDALLSIPRVGRESYPVELLCGLYLTYSGRPRREIYGIVLQELGISAVDAPFDRFNQEFEKRNLRELVDAKLFPDAADYVRSLVSVGKKVFISSSVPQDELTTLVRGKMPKDLIDGIGAVLGSSVDFTKGDKHVQHIEALTGSPRSSIIAFGDDLADLELSTRAGIDCILVDRVNRFAKRKVMTVTSFYQLMD